MATTLGATSITFNDSTTQSTGGMPSKAWVNTDAGSATVYGSFNVSSVTYVSNSNRTVNFTTAFSDQNYAAVIGTSSTTDINGRPYQVTTQSTSNCTFTGTGGTYSGRLSFAFFH